MTGTIQIKVTLAVVTRQDGDAWIAHCPPLDVFSQGSSKAAAVRSLEEAVSLWFESCIEAGVLREALLECGFRDASPSDAIPATGPADQPEQIEISVPAFIASQIHPREHASS